jgi:hypothetical protein
MFYMIYGPDQNGEAMQGNTLAGSRFRSHSVELGPYPNITKRLPRLGRNVNHEGCGITMYTYLNASANFAGRRARNGSVRKATPKQTAAPTRHPTKPRNLRQTVDRATERFGTRKPHLSQRESAKYASSSLDVSLDRNGTYAPPIAL